MNLIWKHIKRLLGMSGILFVGGHWMLVAIGILQRGELARPIHFYYEPLVLQLALLLDFPSLVVAESLGIQGSTSFVEISILDATLLVALITLQWAVLGAVANFLLGLRRI